MPKGRKSQYSDKQKETFAEIAMIARQAGRSWEQTLDAVKKAGFKSSLQYLKQIVEGPSETQVKRDLTKLTRKRRGRPKGSKNKPKVVGRSFNGGAGIEQIDAIVQQEIQRRVTAAIKRVVKVIEGLKA